MNRPPIMEYRNNIRLLAAIDVMVCNEHKLPAIHFKTDNVGAGGIFIKTAPEPYSVGALLDVLFELELSRLYKKNRRYHFSAIVIHSSVEGVGLAFLEAPTETMLAWQQIIHRTCQHHLSAKMR